MKYFVFVASLGAHKYQMHVVVVVLASGTSLGFLKINGSFTKLCTFFCPHHHFAPDIISSGLGDN